MIPYGRQTIEDDDIKAVVDVLKSDWLTQGPKVQEFEEALCAYADANFAVVFSNGTAALQGAYFAAGLNPGDEVVTTPLTFAATSNAALWQGLRPVFADIDPATGNLDPKAAAKAMTSKTKAIVPVDFAGLPVDLDEFKKLAKSKNILIIEDGCHALGATYKRKKIGGLSDMTIFSFHPVKSITTGEGGAVLTNKKEFYDRLMKFRSHGIVRGQDWEYDVEDLGQNYRLTDMQSALGVTQLKKLDKFLKRRREIAARYDEAFKGWGELETATPPKDAQSGWHLYVIKLSPKLASYRRDIFRALRKQGIGVQVHYKPVYYHSLYRQLGYKRGLCSNAEDFYERIISLPMYPTLTDAQQAEVVKVLRATLDGLYTNV